MSDLSDTNEMATMPDWFDPSLHTVREGGIFETATGVKLGEDGEPQSAAVRLMRADAAAAKAVADAAATKPAKKHRGNDAGASGEQE